MIRKILLLIFMITIAVFTIFIQDYGGYNKDPGILEVLCHYFICFFYGYGLGALYVELIGNKKD